MPAKSTSFSHLCTKFFRVKSFSLALPSALNIFTLEFVQVTQIHSSNFTLSVNSSGLLREPELRCGIILQGGADPPTHPLTRKLIHRGDCSSLISRFTTSLLAPSTAKHSIPSLRGGRCGGEAFKTNLKTLLALKLLIRIIVRICSLPLGMKQSVEANNGLITVGNAPSCAQDRSLLFPLHLRPLSMSLFLSRPFPEEPPIIPPAGVRLCLGTRWLRLVGGRSFVEAGSEVPAKSRC